MNINILRKVLGGFSFASALFMFQACYGTPQDINADILIEGRVKSAKTGIPVEGIKVSSIDPNQYQFSDPEGKFSFYTLRGSNKSIHFEDIDSTENGSFVSKDTTLTDLNDHIYLDIELEEE